MKGCFADIRMRRFELKLKDVHTSGISCVAAFSTQGTWNRTVILLEETSTSTTVRAMQVGRSGGETKAGATATDTGASLSGSWGAEKKDANDTGEDGRGDTIARAAGREPGADKALMTIACVSGWLEEPSVEEDTGE